MKAGKKGVQYAYWREDKPAEPGYSPELISVMTPKEFVDELDKQPVLVDGLTTTLDYFERTVKLQPDEPMLGTRQDCGLDAEGK